MNDTLPVVYISRHNAVVGASHQTDWSGVVANLIDMLGNLSAGRDSGRRGKRYFAGW